jgi:uncharacterized damage-inducible protein DinB
MAMTSSPEGTKETSGGGTRNAIMKKESDHSLRQHLIYLLTDGGAHAKFDDAIDAIPAKLRGQKPAGMPHSPWMLLDHMRIAQRDILEFSRNPKYKSPAWPEGYWPPTEAPPNAAAWNESVKNFRKDLKSMENLIADPKTDLFAKIPWGDGQTILREALLVADHNAYHLGQLVNVLRLLGAWSNA